MVHKNHVELVGRVIEVRGGETRKGGYWLRVVLLIDNGERDTRHSFWWFGAGDDRDTYLAVSEGAEVHAIGELQWGRDRDGNWELRVVAHALHVEGGERADRRSNGRDRRNGGERRERAERRGNGRDGRDRNFPSRDDDDDLPL